MALKFKKSKTGNVSTSGTDLYTNTRALPALMNNIVLSHRDGDVLATETSHSASTSLTEIRQQNISPPWADGNWQTAPRISVDRIAGRYRAASGYTVSNSSSYDEQMLFMVDETNEEIVDSVCVTDVYTNNTQIRHTPHVMGTLVSLSVGWKNHAYTVSAYPKAANIQTFRFDTTAKRLMREAVFTQEDAYNLYVDNSITISGNPASTANFRVNVCEYIPMTATHGIIIMSTRNETQNRYQVDAISVSYDGTAGTFTYISHINLLANASTHYTIFSNSRQCYDSGIFTDVNGDRRCLISWMDDSNELIQMYAMTWNPTTYAITKDTNQCYERNSHTHTMYRNQFIRAKDVGGTEAENGGFIIAENSGSDVARYLWPRVTVDSRDFNNFGAGSKPWGIGYYDETTGNTNWWGNSANHVIEYGNSGSHPNMLAPYTHSGGYQYFAYGLPYGPTKAIQVTGLGSVFTHEYDGAWPGSSSPTITSAVGGQGFYKCWGGRHSSYWYAQGPTVAMFPRSRRLAASHRQENTVIFYNMDTYEQTGSVTFTNSTHYTNCLHACSDGDLLVYDESTTGYWKITPVFDQATTVSDAPTTASTSNWANCDYLIFDISYDADAGFLGIGMSNASTDYMVLHYGTNSETNLWTAYSIGTSYSGYGNAGFAGTWYIALGTNSSNQNETRIGKAIAAGATNVTSITNTSSQPVSDNHYARGYGGVAMGLHHLCDDGHEYLYLLRDTGDYDTISYDGTEIVICMAGYKLNGGYAFVWQTTTQVYVRIYALNGTLLVDTTYAYAGVTDFRTGTDSYFRKGCPVQMDRFTVNGTETTLIVGLDGADVQVDFPGDTTDTVEVKIVHADATETILHHGVSVAPSSVVTIEHKQALEQNDKITLTASAPNQTVAVYTGLEDDGS